jgi:hypothetical protein
MPPLTTLALRYVAWFVGLSFLYGILVSAAGLPTSLATGVIIASAPAADVGLQAMRRATRPLAGRDWAVIWGLCMGIYLLLSVVGPAVLALTVSDLRVGLGATGIVQQTVLVIFATAVMQAIFLWIGRRSAGGAAGG